MATVTASARLHFGFQNLSLAHERLYGGLGLALEAPTVRVEATPGSTVEVSIAPDRSGADSNAPRGVDEDGADLRTAIAEHARRTVALLDVPGATVTLLDALPRHVGLGSGTQLALATYAAIARTHDRTPDVRRAAPALGRGGRSGIGVGAFESGGFLVDGGHATARFTTDRPADGEWTVPAIVARHSLPADWRFVLAIPDADPGRSGADEDASMRTVVERADPAIADEIAGLVVRRLLPAAADGRPEAFGAALAEIGRLNGAWYADEQGGVFRPPVGTVVDALAEAPSVDGAGQSSWGPTVYGLTDRDRAAAARRSARDALDRAGVDGTVLVTAVRNRGALLEDDP